MKTLLIIFTVSVGVIGLISGASGQTTNSSIPASQNSDQAKADDAANPNEQQAITLRIMGANLRDNTGSPIGKIENFVVDPGSGKIEFLLVAPYFPTNSTKILPVPWGAVRYRSDQSGMGTVPGANQVFMLNVSRTRLQEAPTFERYRWPDVRQESWRRPVNRFYSIENAENDRRPQSGVFTGASGTPGGSLAGGASGIPAYSNDFIGPRILSRPDEARQSGTGTQRRNEDRRVGNGGLPLSVPR